MVRLEMGGGGGGAEMAAMAKIKERRRSGMRAVGEGMAAGDGLKRRDDCGLGIV